MKAGKLAGIGRQQKPLSEAELELSRLRRELARVKMERDILKKAAAYFARESERDTR
jgi:transposase